MNIKNKKSYWPQYFFSTNYMVEIIISLFFALHYILL